MASPMLQEIFGGSLIGAARCELHRSSTTEQRALIAAIAAGFTGLLSLFNIGGRFFWASLSDQIGRKTTYYTFFVLGIVLYALAPWAAHAGSMALFVACLLHHPVDVWRRLRDRSRPISPTCSARSSSAPSTAGC